MAEWYYFQGGNQQGPVSDDQLRGMVGSGQLQPGDSVWKQGMANWAPISSVPELMPAPAAAPLPRGPAAMPEQPAAPQDFGGYGGGYTSRPAPAGSVKKITIWSIILVSGAGLWFINFFLPWWGITVRGVADTDPEVLKRGARILQDNSAWYDSHISHSKATSLRRFDRDTPSAGATLLGFNTGTGLFAFIIAFFVLGGVITSFFLQILADWRWTGAFFFALMGLILLIFGFLWLFGAPGEDAPPFVSQGISIGPFVHLLATLAVIAGGVLEGLFGLFAFLARIKARPQAQPQFSDPNPMR